MSDLDYKKTFFCLRLEKTHCRRITHPNVLFLLIKRLLSNSIILSFPSILSSGVCKHGMGTNLPHIIVLDDDRICDSFLIVYFKTQLRSIQETRLYEFCRKFKQHLSNEVRDLALFFSQEDCNAVLSIFCFDCSAIFVHYR